MRHFALSLTIAGIWGTVVPWNALKAETLPEVEGSAKPISVTKSTTTPGAETTTEGETEKRSEKIYPSNYGEPGIFRLRSAESLPLFSLTFGIGGEFYSTDDAPGFPGISSGTNATTIAESIFVGFSPIKNLTVAVARKSSSTTFGTPKQLISSLGDFNFSGSYSFPVTESFFLAPIADILIASNFNSLAPAGNTLSAGIGVAATLSLFPMTGLPIYTHANAIYHMPEIRGGTPPITEPETFFRFSRFDTVTLLLGGEIKLGDFFPFLEMRETINAGSGISFGRQPSTISVGARMTPLSNKSLAVLLGADIGIGRGSVPGVPYSPGWQVLGQLSYTVGLSQTERKHYVTTQDVNVVDRKFVVDKSINFKVGSAELEPTSFEVLDQIAIVIQQNNVKKLLIVGHTDSSHNEDYNLKLSLDRANTVKRYLAKKSIPEESMLTQGYGKRKPRASNLTDEGRALNRRVEFYIID